MRKRAISVHAARHPNCAMIAGQGWKMRIWPVSRPRPSRLLDLRCRPAARSHSYGRPRSAGRTGRPATPAAPGIRPLTEDQRDMLDG